jgi:hypothetical protein
MKNTNKLSAEKQNGNLDKTMLCDVLLTEDDLYMVNGLRNGRTSFGIRTLSEDIFNDDLAQKLEYFFEEKQVFADLFNVEYMGFLTGQVRLDNSKIESIIPMINEFLKNIT